MQYRLAAYIAILICSSCSFSDDRVFVSSEGTVLPCFRTYVSDVQCSGTNDQTIEDFYHIVKNYTELEERFGKLNPIFSNYEITGKQLHSPIIDVIGSNLCSDTFLNSCVLRWKFEEHGINIDRMSPSQIQELLLYVSYSADDFDQFTVLLDNSLANLSVDTQLQEKNNRGIGILDCNNEQWEWDSDWITEQPFWTNVEISPHPLRRPIAHRLEIAICDAELTKSNVDQHYIFNWELGRWAPITEQEVIQFIERHPELNSLRSYLFEE